MDAVTYPDSRVVDFVTENVIPLRLAYDAMPYSKDFNVSWTPTLVVTDGDGTEHERSIGYLPPDELIPELMLGIAKTHFDHGRFQEAFDELDRLLAEHPSSAPAPEAVYLRGVSKFEMTEDSMALKEVYERLQRDYPESEWTKRASAYRLL